MPADSTDVDTDTVHASAGQLTETALEAGRHEQIGALCQQIRDLEATELWGADQVGTTLASVYEPSATAVDASYLMPSMVAGLATRIERAVANVEQTDGEQARRIPFKDQGEGGLLPGPWPPLGGLS